MKTFALLKLVRWWFCLIAQLWKLFSTNRNETRHCCSTASSFSIKSENIKRRLFMLVLRGYKFPRRKLRLPSTDIIRSNLKTNPCLNKSLLFSVHSHDNLIQILNLRRRWKFNFRSQRSHLRSSKRLIIIMLAFCFYERCTNHFYLTNTRKQNDTDIQFFRRHEKWLAFSIKKNDSFFLAKLLNYISHLFNKIVKIKTVLVNQHKNINIF